MNLYKINVKYKTMNLYNKFYILFVHNKKMTKNLTSESIVRGRRVLSPGRSGCNGVAAVRRSTYDPDRSVRSRQGSRVTPHHSVQEKNSSEFFFLY